MSAFTTFCAAMLAAATLHAGSAVRITGVDDRAPEPAAWHVFGGRPVAFTVEVRAAARANVRASLYQLAGTIAAPLLKDLPVASGVASDPSLPREEKLVVAIPDVRQPTAMELRFAAREDEAAPWKPAGTTRLIVYPGDVLERMKKRFATADESARVKLIVHGESARLKAALRLADLTFAEAESSASASAAPRTLHLSEIPRAAATALLDRTLPDAHLLLFTSDPAVPAGVYWTTRGVGFTAKVTLPVLTDFARSPDRQWLLLTLLEKALQTIPITP